MKVNPASVPGTLNTTVCADSVTEIRLEDEIEPVSTLTFILRVPSPEGKNEFDWSVDPT